VKSGELRGETDQQLRERLTQLRRERFNLRFQQATGQLSNTARVRAARREAALVMTILNEKAAQAAKEA
jgi:large subunit ribosomal protein L29